MTVHSKQVSKLLAVAAANADEAVEQLRQLLHISQGPLIEPVDGGKFLVTFFWIGVAETVSIRGSQLFADLMAPSHPMEKIVGTDIWHLSVLAPPGVINTYQYVVNDPALRAETQDLETLTQLHAEASRCAYADPYNPAKIYPLAALVLGVEEMPPEQWDSILTTPGAQISAYFGSTAQAGQIIEKTLTSGALGEARTISVHVPADYRHSGPGHPLVILLDGEAWHKVARVDVALENMAAAGRIDSPIVAFVHNVDGPARVSARMRDQSCSLSFNTMLADELLPLLREEFNVAPGPEAVIIGGASLGGLAAAFAAFEHPNQFGNILSSSGTHWWGYADPASPAPWGKDNEPEWLTRQIAAAPLKPVRVWIDVGALETGVLLPLAPGVDHRAANRHFRTVLQAKGNAVTYYEPVGGHEFATFRESFVKAMEWFLGRTVTADRSVEMLESK